MLTVVCLLTVGGCHQWSCQVPLPEFPSPRDSFRKSRRHRELHQVTDRPGGSAETAPGTAGVHGQQGEREKSKYQRSVQHKPKPPDWWSVCLMLYVWNCKICR